MNVTEQMNQALQAKSGLERAIITLTRIWTRNNEQEAAEAIYSCVLALDSTNALLKDLDSKRTSPGTIDE
jgi:hypothetical protein